MCGGCAASHTPSDLPDWAEIYLLKYVIHNHLMHSLRSCHVSVGIRFWETYSTNVHLRLPFAMYCLKKHAWCTQMQKKAGKYLQMIVDRTLCDLYWGHRRDLILQDTHSDIILSICEAPALMHNGLLTPSGHIVCLCWVPADMQTHPHSHGMYAPLKIAGYEHQQDTSCAHHLILNVSCAR